METDELVRQMIHRKLERYEHPDYEIEHKVMTWDEWQSWEPTEDDTPSLVESIKYWSIDALPKGDKNKWNKLQREYAMECYKKELICYELLGRSMRKTLLKNGTSKKSKLQKRK